MLEYQAYDQIIFLIFPGERGKRRGIADGPDGGKVHCPAVAGFNDLRIGNMAVAEDFKKNGSVKFS